VCEKVLLSTTTENSFQNNDVCWYTRARSKRACGPYYFIKFLIMKSRYKEVVFGARILIINPEGKILMGKRIQECGNGTYTMPGGKLEKGESILIGGWRESREECNLDLLSGRIITTHFDTFKDQMTLTFGVVCYEYTGWVKNMEPKLIKEWEWFDPLFLPKAIFFPNRGLIDHIGLYGLPAANKLQKIKRPDSQ
jgi:8-oxo-dGTP diphosphatase